MAVAFGQDDVGRWLDPDAPAEELRTLMSPCPPVWLSWGGRRVRRKEGFDGGGSNVVRVLFCVF